VHHPKGQIVDLEAIGHVPDSDPVIVRVGEHNHLVTTFEKALRQLVDVTLDAASVGKEEIRGHAEIDVAQSASRSLQNSLTIFDTSWIVPETRSSFGNECHVSWRQNKQNHYFYELDTLVVD